MIASQEREREREIGAAGDGNKTPPQEMSDKKASRRKKLQIKSKRPIMKVLELGKKKNEEKGN